MKKINLQTIGCLVFLLIILSLPNITMLKNTVNRQARYVCDPSMDAKTLEIGEGITQTIRLNDQASRVGVFLVGGVQDNQ